MAPDNRVQSWYTDSSYNADENYEDSPFATDPRTFLVRASLTSTSISQPYATIPLPSQHQLYTIEETMSQESIALSQAVKKPFVGNLGAKSGDPIEQSLKSISLIRSRLLQQQESNRKKTFELQQIRSSLDVVHSLVHLVHDQRYNKTWVEFSTNDYKISTNTKNLVLSIVEEESPKHPDSGDANIPIGGEETKTPTQASLLSRGAESDSSGRTFKAMSITTSVPTTPTTPTPPTPNTEIYNLYQNSTIDDLVASTQLASSVEELKSVEPQAQKSYYKTQLSLWTRDKPADVPTSLTIDLHYKGSCNNFSSTSCAGSGTLTTSPDEEWDHRDRVLNLIDNTSNEDMSEESLLKTLSIEPNKVKTT